jgi:tripartite-type tricarboxylate transporter receptor subunit TctC
MRRALLIAVGFTLFTLTISMPFKALSATFPEEGRNIRFIIPFGPGGGMDLTPRSLLPFLKQQLPWKKGEIVPENQDAAAGITGSREIYFSKPDGHTIGIVFSRSLVVPQLLGQVAKFDITKFTYLGQFVNEPSVVFTSAKHPFLKSFSDLKNAPRPVIYALSTIGEVVTYWTLKEKMKLNIKPILGYKSTKESQMAILQGEVDFTTTGFSSSASLYKSGDLKPLFHFGAKPLREAPEVPSVKDLGFEEFAGKLGTDRTIVGPPDIPKDRVEILRNAIWKAMNDPKFIELSEKAERFLDLQDGENARKISLDIINYWTKNEVQLRQAMKEAGM